MPETFRPLILRFDSLPSTNTEAARQAAAGAPEGLCVVAREQRAGRGRRERAWASPKDAGLYASFLLRPRKLAPEAWTLIPLAAAVAVAEALREACALAVDIKWPNDILAGAAKKLCGILAETVETPQGRACVLGIGINLNGQAFPPEVRATATSIEDETGARLDVETLLRALSVAVANRYARLQDVGGSAETLREWSARSSFAAGKRVRVCAEEESFEGVTRGLEPDGALRVEIGAGELKVVRAGDVSSLRGAAG